MLDVVQTSTPAPAPSAALPAAAGTAGNDNDAKITGFQAIMGKAMGAEEKATEKPGEEGEAQADGNALLPSPGEHLPTDGIPLPVATTMPAAVVPPVVLPPADADVQAAPIEGALAEATELPVNAGGRLVDLLRSSLKTEKPVPATPTATPQMPASALPAAVAAAVQSKDYPVIAANGKPAAQGLQLDTVAAAATSIINADTPASYQNTAAFTTALTHAGLAPAAPQANNAAPVPLAVPTPVQQPQWGDDLSDRVVWMVKQDIKSADIRLNPPHLGPLEVKISMAQDQVSVSFSSHHAVVREALDTAMPRLREMMTDNGLQLTNANVSNKSASDHQGGSQHYAGGGRVSGGEDDGASGADGGVLNTASSSLSRYLVDYYA